MVPFNRVVHAVSVVATVLSLGLVLFFIVGSLGLRSALPAVVIALSLWVLPSLQLLACVWAVWKKLPYRVVLPALGLCTACIVYLATDDRDRPPPLDIPPLTDDDAETYRAYRWFVKDGPDSRLAERPSELSKLPRFPNEQSRWPSFLTEHRDTFLHAWTADELGHAWIEAMARQAPAGMFPPDGPKAPVLSFPDVRASATIYWAYAGILALDGQADEAARVLIPALRAYYHLQRGGPSMVVEMIAVICVKGTYQRLELLLDSNALSPKVRAAITEVLNEAPPVTLVLQNSFAGEEALALACYELLRAEKGFGGLPGVDNPLTANRVLQPLLFNRNRTEWEYTAFLREACRLAQERRLTGPEGNAFSEEFERRITSWRIKNPVGQMFIQMAAPAFNKVTDEFWKTEDRRLALIQRLGADQPKALTDG